MSSGSLHNKSLEGEKGEEQKKKKTKKRHVSFASLLSTERHAPRERERC
jgi:hypothetical protein